MRAIAAALGIVLLGGCAGAGTGTRAAPATVPAVRWRAVATVDDRERLSRWRTAWLEALAKVRAAGQGAQLTADPALFEVDRTLDRPVPPAGMYRCRVTKLGAKAPGGLDYVRYPWFACRVGGPGAMRVGAVALVKLTGSQRQAGTIFADGATRAAFLGTLALGDEGGTIRYGRDATRDLAGWVERIGDARWRVAFPYPRFESTLDVLELVPAG